jgi:hypothetical protein
MPTHRNLWPPDLETYIILYHLYYCCVAMRMLAFTASQKHELAKSLSNLKILIYFYTAMHVHS